MGFIKHDTIICTSWEENHLRKAHNYALKLFNGMVSEVVDGAINGQKSFFIPPDGSKEGWSQSDNLDIIRNNFIQWLGGKNLFVDWIAVRFGGDDDTLQIQSGKYKERSE